MFGRRDQVIQLRRFGLDVGNDGILLLMTRYGKEHLAKVRKPYSRRAFSNCWAIRLNEAVQSHDSQQMAVVSVDYFWFNRLANDVLWRTLAIRVRDSDGACKSVH